MISSRDIVSVLVNGERHMLLVALKVATTDAWRQACIDLIEQAPATVNSEALHTCLTEFGHRVREKLDDDSLLVNALRHLLRASVCVGLGQGLVLYRGENLDRFQHGRIGLCWSPTRAVAELIGGGLNAMAGQGGCLLKAYAPAHAVIAGPTRIAIGLGKKNT